MVGGSAGASRILAEMTTSHRSVGLKESYCGITVIRGRSTPEHAERAWPRNLSPVYMTHASRHLPRVFIIKT
jgi:hypothetical protein